MSSPKMKHLLAQGVAFRQTGHMTRTARKRVPPPCFAFDRPGWGDAGNSHLNDWHSLGCVICSLQRRMIWLREGVTPYCHIYRAFLALPF